jgi:hypothetical protein
MTAIERIASPQNPWPTTTFRFGRRCRRAAWDLEYYVERRVRCIQATWWGSEGWRPLKNDWRRHDGECLEACGVSR